MKSTISIVSLAGSLALAAAASGQSTTLYSTGFEASQGYTAGDISSQNGWSTYQPGAGAGYANVTFTAPGGNAGGALALTSGTDGNTSPRYAWPAGYGSAFASAASAGQVVHNTSVDMFMASGNSSTARLGAVTFDDTGARILGGFYVQQNTGMVYLLAYYNNAGTVNNYAFSTNVAISYNTWTTFTTTWDRWTGRMTVSWGSNSFYVDGASIGSIADETDFYGTRNGSTIATTAYFDNLSISTSVPAPGAVALLGLAGLAGGRRRRA